MWIFSLHAGGELLEDFMEKGNMEHKFKKKTQNPSGFCYGLDGGGFGRQSRKTVVRKESLVVIWVKGG